MERKDWRRGLPLVFFVLIFVLSVPIWWFGGKPLPLPVNLPYSALTAFVPAIAAAILVYRRSGVGGVKELAGRAGDFRRITRPVWYLPALLLAPALYVLSFGVLRAAGLPLPWPVAIPWRTLPAYFALFFVTGAGEELGWTAYATGPVQRRWGALGAGLILGVAWALWHSIAFVQTREPAGWIVWQSLKTVAMRVIIVWLYNRSGRSVAAATLYHTTDNVSWALFPSDGSHYSPAVTGVLTALAAIILVLGWGGRAMASVRRGGAGRA